MAILEARFGVL